jgi:hypothetical protein
VDAWLVYRGGRVYVSICADWNSRGLSQRYARSRRKAYAVHILVLQRTGSAHQPAQPILSLSLTLSHAFRPSQSTLRTPTTRLNRPSSACIPCCISSRSFPRLHTMLNTSPTSCAVRLTSTLLSTALRFSTAAFFLTQNQRSLNPHFRYSFPMRLVACICAACGDSSSEPASFSG